MPTQLNGKQALWKKYRLPVILIPAMIAGSVIGAVFGEDAMVLKPLGQVFLYLMFTIVVPLVFFTIASAVGSMANLRRLGTIIAATFGVFMATGCIAAVLVIIVLRIFPPAQGVVLDMSVKTQIDTVSLGDVIVRSVTVPDFSVLFSRSNMLPLIGFSMLVGFCVSVAGGENNRIASILNDISRIMMKAVDVIMLYAPIGLCAYFASLVGEFGPRLLGAYGRAMLIYYPLCVVYFLVFFPLYALFSGGVPALRRLAKHILPPTLTSIATQSSIATLPVNLEATALIGVPKDVRDIALPMGATMHMEGSVMAAALKIAFLFGLFGLDFKGPELYAAAFFVSLMAGIVMSGIPSGGLIGEILIISLFSFPPEAFPIIATIGFLVDPPATCINATGDTVAAMVVTRFIEGKNWVEVFHEGGDIDETKRKKRLEKRKAKDLFFWG